MSTDAARSDEDTATAPYRVPVELASPDLSDARTVPESTRVASVCLFQAMTLADGVRVEHRAEGYIPPVGVILSTGNPRYLRLPPRAEMMTVFQRRGVEGGLPRPQQLVAFAKRYAATLRAGKVPVVIVPDVRYGDADGDRSAHLQAFFAGMVAGALNRKGLQACAMGDHHDLWTQAHYADTLALAVSQGRAAIDNRRIAGGEPHWSPVAAQLSRFERQFTAYHEQRVAAGGHRPADYLWTEHDPRHTAAHSQFAPFHTVMLADYPTGVARLGWMKPIVNFFRPGQNYDQDSSRQLDVFRRWLVTHGPALMGQARDSDVTAVPRPDMTPAQAEADTPRHRQIA